MSNTNQPHSNHFFADAFSATTTKLFPVLLFSFAFLAIFASVSLAQGRYTVNRPISTPAVSPTTMPIPVKEDLSTYKLQHTVPVRWETHYERAKRTAETSSRNLLIYFYADSLEYLPETLDAVSAIPACKKFDTVILDDTGVRSKLDQYVLLKLPINAKITDEDGVEQPILSLPGFEHMLHLPGLLVIDFAHREMPYYGEVVGILPFLCGECPTADQTTTFLTLPPGTLTQRTLTYAVRIHPDKPLSSGGEPAPIVVQLATEHALYQAERGVLGHQNFSARSTQAKEVLGDGMPAEICVQTQSGLSLFEGAIACMRAWRNSSAHWSIARRNHSHYGYDMVRSKNGAWYGVGFFLNVNGE